MICLRIFLINLENRWRLSDMKYQLVLDFEMCMVRGNTKNKMGGFSIFF